MAICLAIMGYFQIVSKFGLGAALISAKDKVEETANAVFYTAIVLSSLMAFVMWQGAGVLAGFFETPELESLLGVICLGLIATALSTVSQSFLYKELKLKKKVVPDVAKGLVKGITSIVLAIMGFGVWALAIGYLAGSIAGSAVTIYMRPWKPGRLPDFATLKRVTGFGLNLIGAETINATPRLLDNVLVGKVLGPAVLGIYALAFRIPEMGIKTFTTVAGSVLHPVMSKIQDDRAELRRYFYQALQYCAVLMFGVGALIAVMSDPLVRVLYTPKWYDMILPMQLIAIAFAVGTLNMVPGNFLKAVNRTDLLFRVSLINLPMFVIVLVVAVQYGIVWVAAGQILLAFLRFIPTYFALKRVMDVTAGDTFRAIFPAVVASAAAALVAHLVLVVLHLPVFVELILGTLAYGVSFLSILYFFLPEPFAMGSRAIARRWSTT